MVARLLAVCLGAILLAGGCAQQDGPLDPGRIADGACAVRAVEAARRAADDAQAVFSRHLAPLVNEFNKLVEAEAGKEEAASQRSYRRLKASFTEISRATEDFYDSAEQAERARCDEGSVPESGPAACPADAAERYRAAYVSAGQTLKDHLQPILDHFERLLSATDDRKKYRATYLGLVEILKKVRGEADDFAAVKSRADERLAECLP